CSGHRDTQRRLGRDTARPRRTARGRWGIGGPIARVGECSGRQDAAPERRGIATVAARLRCGQTAQAGGQAALLAGEAEWTTRSSRAQRAGFTPTALRAPCPSAEPLTRVTRNGPPADGRHL